MTARGKDAVVVSAPRSLTACCNRPAGFVEFMESLYADGLDLDRERDMGREPEL